MAMPSASKRENDARPLGGLVSVGPATLADLALLGIDSVAALARAEPQALYEALCARTGLRHDPCCEDVFAAAIAQARDPQLPAAQAQWWYWSRLRKAQTAVPPRGRQRP
jgi:hypothetical protein